MQMQDREGENESYDYDDDYDTQQNVLLLAMRDQRKLNGAVFLNFQVSSLYQCGYMQYICDELYTKYHAGSYISDQM
jgi:hypothetical protein